jgi:hypothetical protein
MPLRGLRGVEYVPSNQTATFNIAHLPISVLDAFISGYFFISKYLLNVFGVDISIIVSVLILGFAFSIGFHYVYSQLWAGFLDHFTASVSINAYDPTYDNLLF